MPLVFAGFMGEIEVCHCDSRGAADEEWLLLFSLDSFASMEYSAGWADGGVGNFYIRPRDLAKRDFSRVMYYWDCG
jgi:uncharacterized protein YwqG